MCGIAGLWQVDGSDRSTLAAVATRMADALAHRGPDDEGVWVDDAVGIALAHRRLSILDLSPEGHQPMLSADGRYAIVFNGEIYSFAAMRRELDATGVVRQWRGHSDTEILLAAILHWGLQGALERAVGMFAIALWDRRERTLSLIRDRMGEKPLYYGFAGRRFVFGSELKAIRALPGWSGTIDRDAVAAFMRYSYVPAPATIYQGLCKLTPGTVVTVRESDLRALRFPTPVPFWTLEAAVQQGRATMFASIGDATDALEECLRAAIAGQMIADVPLGAFLSGGIDSSTVVALMQAHSSRPVRTFSIGFSEGAYNEADHARAVAKHLSTDHAELIVSPEMARAVIPKLPALYDEPFADSSQIPTFLVSELARRHVTVSLSGDGGDELFGGYNRHLHADAILRRFGWLPDTVRHGIAASITALSPSGWNRLVRLIGPVLPKRMRSSMLGDMAHKYAALLGASTEDQLYERLVAVWPEASLVAGADSARVHANAPDILDTAPERMMYRDMLGYLPDDILAKVDRAAMSVSLETRIPFLDHRVVELASRVPLSMKIRAGQGKYLVRQVLYRHVPRNLIERPKMGFSVPLDGWLRGPLRKWADELLDPNRLRDQGFLDHAVVRRTWDEHIAGTRNRQHRLWNALMFQSWMEYYGGV
ncbi:MAG: asparagine synthase (glutamine-hydrolyzing) [Burkholderiales bacterium]